MLLNVYARKEPSRCPAAIAYEKVVKGAAKPLTDVAIYRDHAYTMPFVRFGPDSSDRPRKTTKVITINCWPWSLHWPSNEINGASPTV